MWFKNKRDYLEQKVEKLEKEIWCMQGKHQWAINDAISNPRIFCKNCYVFRAIQKDEKNEEKK